ncbi:aspartate kinase [Capnocytophaga haemolytica]|uniref:Aspartokinase n=1 Tax=Capnocytophaga haemolytica TaxID=45243 RepID=A0AAX2GY26_9FLAO|nr:aspartate kinase [Capnocytophaga haemolytica]AMD84869.1 aspartate kinase [Capnocytophaga haemolytica]SFN76770.1 aspartate kinase [Capnocytophaga haemolytica]SNV06755.1 Lysine-sensitive aspartokinase 3 [Capnocytophaga haemolytica]
MQIFKFGGASVKDAAGVRNVAKILESVGYSNTLIVISAMGKTTNALEAVVQAYFKDKEMLTARIDEVKAFHYHIIRELFKDENHPVYWKVDGLFAELVSFLERNKSPKHSFVYDQVICFGELISTTIISLYLNDNGIKNTWTDVRNLIKTDSNYRDAAIDWEETQRNIRSGINKQLLNITQGFLGSDANFFTTTLGREGSDYTAAIFAYCLDAESVTIWKDVPGVLNADPRYFEHTELLHKIPYQEAIELAFYGASVIHPKTLQPLQQKEIPLYVRSFVDPTAKGSAVCKVADLEPKVPCFILKRDQTLISLSSLDFSFIMEEHISYIFKALHQAKMKVSVIQNSAISFSVCVDNKFDTLAELLGQLEGKFNVSVAEGVTLYTIRHATPEAIASVEEGKEVLLKQVMGATVQIVTS